MNIWQRVIQADPWRQTRLHDMKGHLPPAQCLVTDMPRAFGGAAARRLFGWRPVLPWLPYNVIRSLSTYVRPDWRVLEYGSGMSTVWLAERVAHVHSIELKDEKTDPAWYAKVQGMLAAHHLRNVRLEQRDKSHYTDLTEYADGTFDFVLVDAAFRDEVVDATLRLVKKPGGVTYLDNTDQGAQWGMYSEAERLLRSAARKERAARVMAYTDFSPCQAIANEGLLVVW